jgi:hypothetical protein
VNLSPPSRAGLRLIDLWGSPAPLVRSFDIDALVWLLFISIVGLATGGYVASRLHAAEAAIELPASALSQRVRAFKSGGGREPLDPVERSAAIAAFWSVLLNVEKRPPMVAHSEALRPAADLSVLSSSPPAASRSISARDRPASSSIRAALADRVSSVAAPGALPRCPLPVTRRAAWRSRPSWW